MELSGFDFIVAKHLIHKSGEYSIASLKKQLPVRGGRTDDDVATPLRFTLEVVFEYVLDDPHFLAATCKSQYGGIGFRRVVSIWKEDSVIHLYPREGSALRNN